MKLKGCQVMKRDYKGKEGNVIGFLPERRTDPRREQGSKSLLKLAHKIFKGTVKDIHSIWLIDVFE